MNYEDEIAQYRDEINRLNKQILELIKARITVALEIGKVKRKYGKPIVDKKREEAVIKQVRSLAIDNGVSPDSAERIFREIIRACIEAEETLD
jgi:chorismate mutase/prephenate dehydratase